MKRHHLAALITPLFTLETPCLAEEKLSLSGEISYTGELWKNTRGGLKTGTRTLHNLDVILEGNFNEGSEEGTSFFLYGLATNKSELSGDLIGDLQVVSNIDNGEVFRLYETWVQHQFASVRVKAGLIDLNSEFDAIEPAGLFINSSHGIGPDFSQTGENGPSIFPSTSPAILTDFSVSPEWQILAGVFDATPHDPDHPQRHKFSLNEGALLIGEVNYRSENGTRIGVGAYHYTSKFAPLLTPTSPSGGNNGLYGIIEGPLTNRLVGWLRLGIANSRLNPLKNYLGGGVVLSHPFSSRPDDSLGLAFGRATAGDDFKQVLRDNGEYPTKGEFNIELTYQFKVNDYISLQPDIQYIINPGSSETLQNALVIGLRFQVGQTF